MVVAERPTQTTLERELTQHRGQWVAIKDDQVVAAGGSPSEVLAELRRVDIQGAALDHVPQDPHTVFVL